ncbi:hypothetical protein D3C87_1579510 [compost metagenome]
MDREFDRDTAGFANALAQAIGQFEVMTVAGRQVGTGLRNADDRAIGLKFGLAEAKIHVSLQIERRHVDIVGIVEPGARTKFTLNRGCNLVGRGFAVICHCQSSNASVSMRRPSMKASATCTSGEKSVSLSPLETSATKSR